VRKPLSPLPAGRDEKHEIHNIKASTMKLLNILETLERYEQGQLVGYELFHLFEVLIRTRLIRRLDSHYQDTARLLIDTGCLDSTGRIVY
jgi:hypothetical protein